MIAVMAIYLVVFWLAPLLLTGPGVGLLGPMLAHAVGIGAIGVVVCISAASDKYVSGE